MTDKKLRMVEFVGGPFDGLLMKLADDREYWYKNSGAPGISHWYDREGDHHMVYVGYGQTKPMKSK